MAAWANLEDDRNDEGPFARLTEPPCATGPGPPARHSWMAVRQIDVPGVAPHTSTFEGLVLTDDRGFIITGPAVRQAGPGRRSIAIR